MKRVYRCLMVDWDLEEDVERRLREKLAILAHGEDGEVDADVRVVAALPAGYQIMFIVEVTES